MIVLKYAIHSNVEIYAYTKLLQHLEISTMTVYRSDLIYDSMGFANYVTLLESFVLKRKES